MRETATDKAVKIHKGKYRYKDYILVNCGYHAPDRCVWWKAWDIGTGYVAGHAHTKNKLMEMIDRIKTD